MSKLPKKVKQGLPIINNPTLLEENPIYKIMDDLKIQTRNKSVKKFVNKYGKKNK